MQQRGFGEENARLRARRLGALALIDKPVSSKQLVCEIDRAFNARSTGGV